MQVQKEEVKPSIKKSLFNNQPSGAGTKQKGSYHNITYKKPYSLMAKYNGKTKQTGQLIYKTDYININLSNELKLFKDFRREKHNCSKATIEKDIRTIYQILGWLHRYKNVGLDSLSLTCIINFIKLNLSYKNFKDEKGKTNHQEYSYAKAMLRQEVIDLANENKALIEEYTKFIGGHPNTKVLAVMTCMAVAKFVFKDEIETEEYENNKDLPIIKRLNSLSTNFGKKSKSTPPKVAPAAKNVSWNETEKILETLRQRVHCLERETILVRNTKEGEKQYVYKIPRKKISVVNNLQRFLSLAFMVLIPTDRPRTYYELEIGRTFRYGFYHYKEKKFTPVEELEDKNQALWYINLKEGDYKTYNTYGEYWGIMPNKDFGDGNRLYDYISQWINEGREYEQKCNHNYFFREARTYQPLYCTNWSNRIKIIFINQAGVPVTPKELRRMYITHLNNIGASDAERRGARHAMHHSQKMQDGTYNCQDDFERVAPIMDLNERMWKEASKPSSDNI